MMLRRALSGHIIMLHRTSCTARDLVHAHVCIVITKESELHHSIGSLIDGAHPGPKTDSDYLGRYVCLRLRKNLSVITA